MSKHICVYFEDESLEQACVCGERVVLLDEGDGTVTLALLDAAPCEDAVAA